MAVPIMSIAIADLLVFVWRFHRLACIIACCTCAFATSFTN
jgi:hypothetical protein